MKFSLIYYIKNHHRIRNIYRRIKKVDIYIAENTDEYLNREYMERIHNVIEKVLTLSRKRREIPTFT
jgi:hypothetical protein